MYTQTTPLSHLSPEISALSANTTRLQSMLGDSLRREEDFLYQREQTEQLSWLEKRLILATLHLIDGVHYLLLALGVEKKSPTPDPFTRLWISGYLTMEQSGKYFTALNCVVALHCR